jgi:anionic cell wall polymer biosynthesis LytR-Cps2A-Psr (LCP) family protein
MQTVEQLTGVRVDRYVAIDFDGLVQMTDDRGGVQVTVAEATANGRVQVPPNCAPAHRATPGRRRYICGVI